MSSQKLGMTKLKLVYPAIMTGDWLTIISIPVNKYLHNCTQAFISANEIIKQVGRFYAIKIIMD